MSGKQDFNKMKAERAILSELASKQAKDLFTEYMVKNGLGKHPLASAVSIASRGMK